MTEISHPPTLKIVTFVLRLDLFYLSNKTDVFAGFAHGLTVGGIDEESVIPKIASAFLPLARNWVG